MQCAPSVEHDVVSHPVPSSVITQVRAAQVRARSRRRSRRRRFPYPNSNNITHTFLGHDYYGVFPLLVAGLGFRPHVCYYLYIARI